MRVYCCRPITSEHKLTGKVRLQVLGVKGA